MERTTTRRVPNEPICDVGFVVTSGLDALATSQITVDPLIFDPKDVRGVSVLGQDGMRYALVANFGAEDATVEVWGRRVILAAGKARVVVG